MKKFFIILITPAFILTLLFWSYYCASLGFEGATVLAIKDGEIAYKGKIYSVRYTGETYPTKEFK